ncbi:hypothetical protein M758_UG033900 [Ceratodon purpureus]|nr:hypothetical protein M758_UG033900 [Ceratodon purpureus]
MRYILKNKSPHNPPRHSSPISQFPQSLCLRFATLRRYHVNYKPRGRLRVELLLQLRFCVRLRMCLLRGFRKFWG